MSPANSRHRLFLFLTQLRISVTHISLVFIVIVSHTRTARNLSRVFTNPPPFPISLCLFTTRLYDPSTTTYSLAARVIPHTPFRFLLWSFCSFFFVFLEWFFPPACVYLFRFSILTGVAFSCLLYRLRVLDLRLATPQHIIILRSGDTLMMLDSLTT